MKKKIVYALLIALGIFVTGCGKEAEAEKTQEKAETINVDTEKTVSKDVNDTEVNKVNIADSENCVPEYYSTYSDLLHQFMNGEDAYFMNNDYAESYIEQDGVSCS